MVERGTILGGTYEILSPLGKGGMSEVFQARHQRTEFQVAVKILHAKYLEKPHARDRLEREAKAAGRVDHENICEVLDLRIENNISYLVMPLLKGLTLASLLKQTHQLPIERACSIALQTLDGLEAAHQKGIIHRDLKPDNIFLVQHGSGESRSDFVKILDFGITKFIDSENKSKNIAEKTLTQTGEVLGTPYYMSPEQVRGEKDIDGRVDLYAVGVVLYEMLTGNRPFTGDTPQEILWKIWNEPVKTPKYYRPELSEELEKVIRKMMARDPENRYQSAEDIKADIQKARTSGYSTETQTLATLQTSDAAQLEGIPSPDAHNDQPQRSSRYSLLQILGMVALLFLASGVSYFVGLNQSQAPDPSVSVNESPPSPEAPSPDIREVPPQKLPQKIPPLDVEKSTPKIRITLGELPPGAQTTIGDKLIEGSTQLVKRSTEPLLVQINVKGYQPWKREIIPDTDTNIAPELVKIRKNKGLRTQRIKRVTKQKEVGKLPPSKLGPMTTFGSDP